MKNAHISAARASMVATVLTVGFLILMHVLSPEMDPSWRMVSEYAKGQYAWVLKLFFLFWGAGSFLLLYAMAPCLSNTTGKGAGIFLLLSGIGEWMAAIFSVGHPMHEMAGVLGILGLPLATTLFAIGLSRLKSWSAFKNQMRWYAYINWVALLFLIGCLMVLYADFTRAGGKISNDVTQLPPGVHSICGWANRAFILIGLAWIYFMATSVIRVYRKVAL